MGRSGGDPDLDIVGGDDVDGWSSDSEGNELDELEVSGGSRKHIHPASELSQE